MIRVRKGESRGTTNLGWLESKHSFSFGAYRDPEWTQFRSLRVLNDDRVAAGGGFGTHPHRDMEIITLVLAGALEHKDSTGGGGVLRPGDVQRMSAGTGVTHSEFNHSKTEPVHFLQVWLHPDKTGLEPRYGQEHFEASERRGRLRVVVSPDGRDGSLAIHQDAVLLNGLLAPGDRVEHGLDPSRHGYVHVATGAAVVNGERLRAGDGLAMSEEEQVEIEASEPSEVLVFDLG